MNKFIPNPTFDPVAAPGVMDEYFRGRNPKGADPGKLFGELEPIRPEYRDRDARLALMDTQGMEGCILLPTLGVGMEQALAHDLPALTAAFRAFNRWLAEDWGFAYQERIFAAPYITLADPDNAARELAWALERDARFVVMVGGPVTTAAGMRAPADEMFDPFWRLADEAGITVCYHGGETGYTKYLADWGESDFTEAFRATAFRGLVSADAVQDTIASHLARGLFRRFPNLRIASIEIGSAWVFHLFEKLTKTYGQVPHLFPEDPQGDLQAARVGVPVLRGRPGRPAGACSVPATSSWARTTRTWRAWPSRPPTSRTCRTSTTPRSSARPSCATTACSSPPAVPASPKVHVPRGGPVPWPCRQACRSSTR